MVLLGAGIHPAQQRYAMSDEDLGALLAYIQSLPPGDNQLPELKLALFPRLIFLLGPLDFLVPAESIDHDAPRPAPPAGGVTAESGAYLAGLRSLCHGPGFTGGPIPGTPSEDPPAPNLTPAGELRGRSLEEFPSLASSRAATMRKGCRQNHRDHTYWTNLPMEVSRCRNG